MLSGSPQKELLYGAYMGVASGIYSLLGWFVLRMLSGSPQKELLYGAYMGVASGIYSLLGSPVTP